MKYLLIYEKIAIKDLENIDKNDARHLYKKIEQLANETSNLDVKQLKSFSKPTYRLRWGDYRVIYEKHQEKIIIVIVMAGHRKDIYKRLGRAL